MTTKLMTQPCGDDCNQETEFLVSFVVMSLEMTDRQSSQLFKDVLVVITWDGNVVKLKNENEDAEEFKESMKLLVHGTPNHMATILKTSPIMFDVSRGCSELGSTKLEISECFADAVLCADFNSQTVTVDLKFSKNEIENANMTAYFRIQKLLNDGNSQNLFKELSSKKSDHAKKLEKQRKKLEAGGADNDDYDDDSENDPCDDFACPDDLPEHCKRDLGLNQNVYRIINGNLLNLKDKIGPCGEVCPVAGKYIKELCKSEPEDVPLSSRFHFDSEPKCGEIFDASRSCGCKRQTNVTCPDCGGRLPSRALSMQKDIRAEPRQQLCKDNWIDRNIREEDLLKKLCDKYGISVDEVRAIGQETESGKCKKTKKRKVKKVREAKKCKENPCDGPFAPLVPQTREKFIKVMKRKYRGKYSFDFGNNYTAHSTCCKVEKGAGDASSVPKYMGWRWDAPILGICDKKWFPGRIHPMVRCLMKHALNPFPYDTIPLTRRDTNGRIMKTCIDTSRLPKFNPDFVQKPTLRVQKRDGEYFIAMHPLKSKAELETDYNPYLDCSPLTFNIKPHPEKIKISRAVKLLRERGLEKKCSCVSLTCCRCKSETQKKLFTYEMKNVSKQLKMKAALTYADLNADSDSDLDLEFTTPSAIVDPRKFKPDVVHCGTQYGLRDFTTTTAKAMFAEIATKKEKALEEKKQKALEKLKALEKAQKASVKPQSKKSKSTGRKMESILIDPPCKPVTCAPRCAAPKSVAFRC